MRHAHAKLLEEGSDFDRELKNKGKRAAQRIGVWIDQNKLHPDVILTSPATRALRTAQKCCKTSGLGTRIIAPIDQLYKANAQEFLKLIAKTPEDINRLMVVGHNPTLENVLAKLTKDKDRPHLKPGTLVHLELDKSWDKIDRAKIKLKQIIYPKTLPETFPFKTESGIEQRVRPAYYYRQSCVIPFRYTDRDQLEVMIISSSARKHWVFPKGIHDPGLTAQASAAQEAFEEAGLEGRVYKEPLGQFVYEKWEATSTCTVYPMEVDNQLSDEEWEENSRLRKWVRLEVAIQEVDNPNLCAIAAKLPGYLRGMSA